MELKLEDRVAVVTGATGGIGAPMARLLAAEGASVVPVSRDAARLEALAAEIGATVVVAADLTDGDTAARVIEVALHRHGRVDVLVNAAGAAMTGALWDMPDQALRDSFELKVLGTLRMLRAVVPVMRAQGFGRVLSIVGETGRQPRADMLPGAAANAALLAVTKAVADEVAAYGITVNALNPGPTRTPRLERIIAEAARRRGVPKSLVVDELVAGSPLGALAEPLEIARLAVVLVSDLASHVTGTALTVDGGRTRSSP
jgi:3-oxoacyl-[acyl-carrier protein] reductase